MYFYLISLINHIFVNVFVFSVAMVYSRSEKKERDSKKTEYMRNYRQRVSEEKRKEWAKQGSLRKKQSREKAAEARQVRAKQIRSEQNRRAYVKNV